MDHTQCAGVIGQKHVAAWWNLYPSLMYCKTTSMLGPVFQLAQCVLYGRQFSFGFQVMKNVNAIVLNHIACLLITVPYFSSMQRSNCCINHATCMKTKLAGHKECSRWTKIEHETRFFTDPLSRLLSDIPWFVFIFMGFFRLVLQGVEKAPVMKGGTKVPKSQ